MKTAEELLSDFTENTLSGLSFDTKSIDTEKLARVNELCRNVLVADGNRAMIIARIVGAGIWDSSVADACDAILNAPGDQALAFSIAFMCGNCSKGNPCQVILNAAGDKATAIINMIEFGTWNIPWRETCQVILNDSPGTDKARAIYVAATNGWWDNSVADPCQAILDSDKDGDIIDDAIQCDWWVEPIRY